MSIIDVLYDNTIGKLVDIFKNFLLNIFIEIFKGIFNIYTIIPLLVKILLDFISIGNPLFRIVIVLFSFILSNVLRTININKCNLSNIKLLNYSVRMIIDSLTQYTATVIIILILKFIPVIGQILMLIDMIPLVGYLINILIWILSYAFAFWLTNIFGGKSTNICNEPVSRFNIGVGVVSGIVMVMNELLKTLF
jgi:hypothetical protein